GSCGARRARGLSDPVAKAMSSAAPATVRVERRGRVATVWIERPPLNILDLDTLSQLDVAVDDLRRQAAEPESGLQLAVVRGGGDRAFSAGVAIEDHVGARIPRMLEVFHRALRRLFALDVPTVAAVDGHCLGGGMELAAVCDLVIATERSSFGQPEIKLACFPPVAAVLYPSLIGPGRTFDLLLTGRRLSCRDAEACGFVARRVPDGGLDAALGVFASELGASSTPALRLTKKAIRLGQARARLLDEALDASERLYLEELAQTADMEEGVAAFLAKRPPAWTHR
ncbi:MAG: enoyl-CoA hydratase-related protein, partial [Acidobacteriota bacterium]